MSNLFPIDGQVVFVCQHKHDDPPLEGDELVLTKAQRFTTEGGVTGEWYLACEGCLAATDGPLIAAYFLWPPTVAEARRIA